MYATQFRRRNSRPQAPRRGRPQHRGQFIHHSKFVNKAADVPSEAAYQSTHRFADFLIDERIKGNIAKKGYVTPTPIQDQAIPLVLEGRDVLGIANTGTGKTGAFLIPLLDKVVKARDERVLVIAPTRELAVQIDAEYRGFSHGSGLKSVCAVGGVNISPQIRALKDRPYFVIGTPGRLKDLMERGVLDLSAFRNVVLDEADRMLDMGFIDDMRFILSRMPHQRHTLLFSATLSPEIERLIGEFLHDEARVSVKTRDTSKDVDQDIVRIAPGAQKIDVLRELLERPEFRKVLIFGRTKHGVERLSRTLRSMGFTSESIHGNKSSAQRERALKAFKDERAAILVATDVAARGLDIPKVSHVINYDQPNTYEDYVHRIGRTGRAGERGVALTFVE
jgi:superfamily II DNA/RNA helicase